VRPLYISLGLGIALVSLPAAAQEPAIEAPQEPKIETPAAKRADFGHEPKSREAHRLADWIVDSGDSRGLPFVILDKRNARIYVFDSRGSIRGASAALLGAAKGDHSVPGIGERELSAIRPQDRTTAAGRFVAALGRNLRGEDIVWVDYDTSLSLHRVINNARDRRLARLATPTASDNRISYGCINVPVRFYETVVSPAFRGTEGIVYVMPEIRTAREVFGSYEVD
jgi:hypothetical protein